MYFVLCVNGHNTPVESLVIENIKTQPVGRINALRFLIAVRPGLDMACNQHFRDLHAGYTAGVIVRCQNGFAEKLSRLFVRNFGKVLFVLVRPLINRLVYIEDVKGYERSGLFAESFPVGRKLLENQIIKTFVSEVYLYDDRMIVNYNICRNKESLDSSIVDLLSSPKGKVFDERITTSTKKKNPANA